MSPPNTYPCRVRSMNSHKPPPQRVHLHAYERLRSICAEIQRGRYPTVLQQYWLKTVDYRVRKDTHV
jgi:hypothetical protein